MRVEPSRMGLVPWEEETWKGWPVSPPHWDTARRWPSASQEESPYQTKLFGILILDFSASRTVSNKCLLFKPPRLWHPARQAQTDYDYVRTNAAFPFSDLVNTTHLLETDDTLKWFAGYFTENYLQRWGQGQWIPAREGEASLGEWPRTHYGAQSGQNPWGRSWRGGLPVGVGGREAASYVEGTQPQGTLDACFSTVSSDLLASPRGQTQSGVKRARELLGLPRVQSRVKHVDGRSGRQTVTCTKPSFYRHLTLKNIFLYLTALDLSCGTWDL